jgi:hypothetical protein
MLRAYTFHRASTQLGRAAEFYDSSRLHLFLRMQQYGRLLTKAFPLEREHFWRTKSY